MRRFPATCAISLLAAFLVGPLVPAGAEAEPLPRPIKLKHFHFDGVYADAKVALGKLLFFDKILSGNQNIACATCHSPLTHTTDGLPLSIGEGGLGLGITRDLGGGADAVPGRVPRNAMTLFNLGHESLTAAFHDGRVEEDADEPSGFASPAGLELPLHLDTAMAAQAMFPVASTIEMAGQEGENTQADLAAAGDFTGVWEHVAGKLRAIPEYVDLFVAAFRDDPEIPVEEAEDITFVHAANAIFAWEATVFRSIDTPFDRYLRGDKKALGKSARQGMELFFGKARCSRCHAGALLTDARFHSIALPQIGPGTGDGPDGLDDFGRERVTGDVADRFRFRTPPLRNVALTAPYGHDGAYARLDNLIRHHIDAVPALEGYKHGQVNQFQPSRPDLDATDFALMADPDRVDAIGGTSDLPEPKRRIGDKQLQRLVDFLVQGLTDPSMLDLRQNVPLAVPSGLPVAN
jgi:cytochrome c peroxidase